MIVNSYGALSPKVEKAIKVGKFGLTDDISPETIENFANNLDGLASRCRYLSEVCKGNLKDYLSNAQK